ncbi:hypothetical protein CEXT_90861 [Caerostris extrusa]|uniref:Uncharacterized protein n=1 Tax=Caerostris extrusa TaxID=172846 RepID=A0AAV4SA05_CAEEX|nr:hypothetical protein CEXT_90861 [Caerostris extrusa]
MGSIAVAVFGYSYYARLQLLSEIRVHFWAVLHRCFFGEMCTYCLRFESTSGFTVVAFGNVDIMHFWNYYLRFESTYGDLLQSQYSDTSIICTCATTI